LLPANLIGDHALGHWEQEVGRRRYPRLSYWERNERTSQSFVDSTTFRLRRALMVDPTLHARLNAAIKERKVSEEPQRLLAGTHDVPDFVRMIARDHPI